MNGNELKTILRKTGKQMNEIATLIGITPQALNQILKSADVKSGTLETLADKLEMNICEFYGGDAVTATNNSLAIKGNGNNTNSDNGAFLSLLSKKDEQIDRLLSIIETISTKA